MGPGGSGCGSRCTTDVRAGRPAADGGAQARGGCGVQLLGGHYAETIALAHSVGAVLYWCAPPGGALWRGRAHTLTYGSVASMATSRLPTGLKPGWPRYIPSPAICGDANAPVAAAELTANRSRRGAAGTGDDFIELLVYPQLAYYATTPEQTSARSTMPSHGWGWTSLYAVRGGMAALAQVVVRALRAREARSSGRGGKVVRAGPSGVGWCGRRRRSARCGGGGGAGPVRGHDRPARRPGPHLVPGDQEPSAAAVASSWTGRFRRLFRALRATGRGARQGCGGSRHSGAKAAGLDGE